MKKILILHFGYNVKTIDSTFKLMNWQTEVLNLDSAIYELSKAYDAFLICINDIEDSVLLGLIRYLKTNSKSPVIVLDHLHNKDLELKLYSVNLDMYLSGEIDARVLYKYVSFAVIKYDLADASEIRYKDLVLDMNKRTVCRGNKCIELRNKEFDLLCYLLQNPGIVLSKTRILEAVWDMNALTNTTTVESHVSTLRRKIDKDFEERLLHTVHCVGYKIE